MPWLRCLVPLILAAAVTAQTVEVPNAGFEAGDDGPLGWTLSGGAGELLPGAEGRGVGVTGTGEDDNYWRSEPLPLSADVVYRLRFRARGLGAAGGTPISGPSFANNDLGQIGDEWRWYTQIFAAPRNLTPETAWLRFGQWHVDGTVAYDQITLAQAQPVYTRVGGLTLGAGERLAGPSYRFQAPFGNGNHSRPLQSFSAGYNTHRWVFGAGSDVVYEHVLPGHRFTAATVRPTIGWYRGGELRVEASRDGADWTLLGTASELGAESFAVPAELLPAESLQIRLVAQAKERVGTDSDPGSFQIHGYEFEATVDGPPVEALGRTAYVAVTAADPRLKVAIQSLGDGPTGGGETLTAEVVNLTDRPLEVHPMVSLIEPGASPAGEGERRRLAPGTQQIEIPYQVRGTGTFDLVFDFGAGVNYRAVTTLTVPELYRADYGERLPADSERVGLWWAESGWKISRERGSPAATGAAVRLAAARNEAEAAQLVLRPTATLRALTATATALTSPAGATVPAGAIDLLEVRYVAIDHPTDRTGVAGLWPDPLPPLTEPIEVAAGTNQPLWVRITVPRDTPAGTYRGAIRLNAEGYAAEAPVELEVFDFTLPDRMSLTTAFGFDPGRVFAYQNLTTEAQRREVLDRYWANFSAHHISPYDPVPLDRFKVAWPRADDWQNGLRDTEVKHGGQASLKVVDASETVGAGVGHPAVVKIPPAGLRFRFWYRTGEPDQAFIASFNHLDAEGQWLSGRNNDLRLVGNGKWQEFDRTVTSFPDGAKSLRVTLWPTLYAEPHTPMGTVWYDDLVLTDAGTGEVLLAGDFEPLTPDELIPTIDWAAFDLAMTRAIEDYHFNSYRLPLEGLGGGTFHSRREPALLGYAEDTVEYRTAFASYLKQIEDHLRQKGWLDEAYVYWFDEPDPDDYEFVLNGFRKLKENAPGLRRMLTEQPEEALFGGPNIWCPLSNNFNPDQAAPRMAIGEEFWWYVCTGPKAPFATLFIDHPATELRVWAQQTWQRGIKGILVWQSNYWTSSAAYPDGLQNPYEDPMSWVSGYDTPAGTKRAWGNGDGRFLYPPLAAAGGAGEPVIEGPVDSLRWEMLRDGIEDYEYLALLEQLLAETRDLSDERRREYAALLTVPDSISQTATQFTTDPRPILARRRELAAALASFGAGR